jgi:predicted DNA-binding ribbon-helix-helix protein
MLEEHREDLKRQEERQMMSLRVLQERRGINTPLHVEDVEFWAITKDLARERQLLIG